MTKQCSVCSQTKPIQQFYRNAGTFSGGGHQHLCKACADKVAKKTQLRTVTYYRDKAIKGEK